MIEDKWTASPGYALGRIERALEALRTHENAEVRARALEKIATWAQVIEGMQSGVLGIGTRAPVVGAPAWVTLEVAHGGFATGRLLAERPLDDWELGLLERIDRSVPGQNDRERLNAFFIGDAGQAMLLEAAREARYRIDVPEEGALVVAALLIERGQSEAALDLIQALRPWFDRLRLYPRFEAVPRSAASTVRVATVKEVAEALAAAEVSPPIARMIEALELWSPLYDRLVSLWLSTVEGDAPTLDATGKVAGGWPCKKWPADWRERRASWLEDYRAAKNGRPLCKKHADAKSNFARLCDALERCEKDSARLKPRQVGWIRRALANTIAAHGAPGSQARSTLRDEQARFVARPTHARMAQLVARRLAVYPAAGGFGSLDPIAQPVLESEASSAPPGYAIPEHLIEKAARALEAPIDELIERHVIASAEVLAIVLPQITAQVAAAGIDDAALRDVYQRVYAAFRRRRSLLLLNLEHQVRIEELPWVQALWGARKAELGDNTLARRTLAEVTLQSLTAFPQTILPNRLLKEMDALVTKADLPLPITEELASDIFMGTFTKKWLRAAELSSELLEGTLYARYYDLPPAAVHADRPGGLLSRVKKRWAKETADGFAELCQKRAKEAGEEGGSFVAKNGAVIEQSQIMTTHNLAPLTVELGLADQLRAVAPTLAERSFAWIVRRQNQSIGTFQARLQMLKNTAYAWRQALFFLSLADRAAQARVLAALETHVMAQDTDWAGRFWPAVEGLRQVMGGAKFDTSGRVQGDAKARRFLGWSVGRHWLLPAQEEKRR